MTDIGEKLAKSQGINLWEIQEDENGNVFTWVEDEEMDFYKVYFNYDGCAKVETKGFTYIVMSVKLLGFLFDTTIHLEGAFEFKYENNLDDEPIEKVLELYEKSLYL